jgi:hypothetical protein
VCLLGTPRGKRESQRLWHPLGPNHLLHDGPNEAAAQNNGGHHQQVEVDQVEVLSGGRGLGVTWAPCPYMGFSHTHHLPLPSPFHRDCPHSLTFIGLQLSQARKLPRGVEQDPEKGSGTVPGNKRMVCEPSRSPYPCPVPIPLLLPRALSILWTPVFLWLISWTGLKTLSSLRQSLCQIPLCYSYNASVVLSTLGVLKSHQFPVPLRPPCPAWGHMTSGAW